jgi:hypothetical protein
MNNKKIIFTHGGGRFGNQLLNYIHLTAFGLEYKRVSIKLNSLNDYLASGEKSFIVSNGKIDLLTKVNSKKKNRFMTVLSRVMKNSKIRIWHFYIHYFTNNKSLIIGESGNNIGYLSGKKYNDLVLNSDFFDSLNENTLLAGWNIRNWDLVNKWRDIISKNLLNTLKQKDSRIKSYSIGVHIRGNDFKTHADGLLYFDNDKWIEALKIIEKKLNVKNIIIMSDEIHNWNKILMDNSHWTLSSGSYGQDSDMFHSFSDLLKCDIILTAGSTFALMAAWISNAKVIDISSIERDVPINLMEFNEWSNHNNFLINWK